MDTIINRKLNAIEQQKYEMQKKCLKNSNKFKDCISINNQFYTVLGLFTITFTYKTNTDYNYIQKGVK